MRRRELPDAALAGLPGGTHSTPPLLSNSNPLNKTMKLSVPTLVTILALGGGTTALWTGCASTATRQSTGEYVDDAAITSKVKAAFVKDPLVKALDVKVDTFKGNVQLNGFVDTQEQKSRAEQIAASVPNVTKVQNNISVKGSASAR